MASYSFGSTVWWIQNSTSSSGYVDNKTFGNSSFYIADSNYATKGIISVTLSPASGKTISKIKLTIGINGVNGSDSNTVYFYGHMYNSLSTAKNGYYSAPSGYISSATSSAYTKTDIDATGKNVNFTFSNLNITSSTTVYIRFSSSTTDTGTKAFAVYTCASGSVITNPSISITEASTASRTLSFSANGGYNSEFTKGAGAPSSITKTVGTAITIPTTQPTHPNLTSSSDFYIYGYQNDGTTNKQTVIASIETSTPAIFQNEWSDYYDNAIWYSGSSWNMDESMTLYAVYAKGTPITSYSNNTLNQLTTPSRTGKTETAYTISFNTNGGNSVSSLSNQKGTTYEFLGWNTKSDGTGVNYMDGSTSFTSTQTLYANWKTNEGLTSITLPNATRSGYNFIGWASTSSASSADIGQAGDSYTPTESKTLYAVWKSQSMVTKMWPHTVWIYNNSAGKYEQYIPYVYSPSDGWKICGNS